MTFSASPTSPSLPEFIWTNEAVPQLIAGPGSIGNGDGNMPPLQTFGGLEVQTLLSVVAPGSRPLIGGGTELDDCTIVLSNFRATALAGNSGILAQTFGQMATARRACSMSFPPISTYAGPLQPVLLLEVQ